METSSVISLLVAVLSSGGVIYLIAEKLFQRREDRAKAKQMEADAKRADMEAAEKAFPLYHEIRDIVRAEVEPLKQELDYLKTHYCCYRDECEMRLLFKPTDTDNNDNK